MNRHAIQELLLRFRNNECTEEEAASVLHWYAHLNEDFSPVLDERDKQELEDKILQKIWDNIIDAEVPSEHEIIPIWRKTYARFAASIVIFLLAYGFYNYQPTELDILNQAIYIEAPTDALVVDKNDSSLPKEILLEDQSVITLTPGSQIIYPSKFSAESRSVQLVGDAFFSISKDAKRPFFVYSGKLVTQVLGTSFRIKSYEDAQAMDVEVVTGKVAVFENTKALDLDTDEGLGTKKNNGVILTPNQRVTYFPKSGHLMTGLVIQPVQLANKVEPTGRVFNDEPLDNIMNSLQLEFGIEIVFANDRIEDCTFTGDLNDMTLYEKLDLICASNRVFYEVKGTRILINGQGCE